MTKRHDPAVRAEALRLTAVHGATAAAQRLNVPIATVRSWQRREGQRARRSLVRAGVHDPELLGDHLPLRERRDRMVATLGIAAAEALEACRQATAENSATSAKNYGVLFAVLIDKWNLLSGGATSRSESFTIRAEAEEPVIRQLDDEIAVLRAELEAEGADVAADE